MSEPDDTHSQKAHRFIEAVNHLSKKLNILKKISGIVESEIPIMVERALREANPLYPVPKIFYEKDLTKLYHSIKE